MIRSQCNRVLIAIARGGSDPHDSDRALWRELADDLAGEGVTVTPLQVLPAA